MNTYDKVMKLEIDQATKYRSLYIAEHRAFIVLEHKYNELKTKCLELEKRENYEHELFDALKESEADRAILRTVNDKLRKTISEDNEITNYLCGQIEMLQQKKTIADLNSLIRNIVQHSQI